MCLVCIFDEFSRSAMVRATLSVRCNPRPDILHA